MRKPWRVGRKLGRTIYEHAYTDGPSDDDRLIGIMDAPRHAAWIVELHNAEVLPCSEEGPSEPR